MINQEWEIEFDRYMIQRITWLLEESRGYLGRAHHSPIYAYWVGLNLGWCIESAKKIHDADLQSAACDWIYGCREAVFEILA